MNEPIDITGVVLQTPRLKIRPWKESDLEDFYAYAKVDGVGQMAGWLPHRDIVESEKILSRFIQGRHVFALEHEGKVIGSLGIEEYNEANYPELSHYRGRELGYVLSKEYWGRGLMPEAVDAVVKWLFDVKKLDLILVGHFEWNSRSRRVAEKCGFRYIKTNKYETRYGTVENSVEYILTRPVEKLTHRGTQTLETPRLCLRKARPEDGQPMYKNWASDREVTKFLTWPTYTAEEQAHGTVARWMEECKSPDRYQWMIELKELGEPIGSISVVKHREDIGEFEIGYCIGKKWWHQGIMTESLRAVIDFLFREVGASRIEAMHDVRNANSGAVMKKCGMTFEGVSRASDRNNLGTCDMAKYAILRSDWENM